MTTIYTDGSCRNYTGGWAYCTMWESPYKCMMYDYDGHIKKTTNNRMEITAVIEALKTCPRGDYVCLYSDSQYAVSTIGEGEYQGEPHGWMANWGGKKYIPNNDLWKKLIKLLTKLYHKDTVVSMTWVKAHNGDKYNEFVDKLAGLYL